VGGNKVVVALIDSLRKKKKKRSVFFHAISWLFEKEREILVSSFLHVLEKEKKRRVLDMLYLLRRLIETNLHLVLSQSKRSGIQMVEESNFLIFHFVSYILEKEVLI